MKNIANPLEVAEYLNNLLISRHVGDINMARTIHTEWYLGEITKPMIGDDKMSKSCMKHISTRIKASLPLPVDFTGAVAFYINQGKLVKTDIRQRR